MWVTCTVKLVSPISSFSLVLPLISTCTSVTGLHIVSRCAGNKHLLQFEQMWIIFPSVLLNPKCFHTLPLGRFFCLVSTAHYKLLRSNGSWIFLFFISLKNEDSCSRIRCTWPLLLGWLIWAHFICTTLTFCQTHDIWHINQIGKCY